MRSAQPDSGLGRSASLRLYICALAAGLLSTLCGYIAAIAVLERLAPEHLPAPQITNQIHLDEKLRFLRDHPHFQPVMLGFGSSGVLRSVDFAAFQRAKGPPFRFLNLGIPGASIKETRANSRFFLSKFPSARAVLTILVPPDFKSCSGPVKPYDFEDAWAFATGRLPSAWFYLKYFSLLDFVSELGRIAEDRTMSARGERQLYHDRFGSGPVEMDPAQARSVWGAYTTHALDPACFAELAAWRRELEAAGIALYVVLFPVSPEWLAETPGAKEYIQFFERRLRSELVGAGVRIIDGNAIFEGAPDSHVDAYHLQWSAARLFSRRLGDAIVPELAVASHRNEPAAREPRPGLRARAGSGANGRCPADRCRYPMAGASMSVKAGRYRGCPGERTRAGACARPQPAESRAMRLRISRAYSPAFMSPSPSASI